MYHYTFKHIDVAKVTCLYWNDRKYSYDSIIVCRNVSSYAVAQAAPLLEQDNRKPGNYGSSDMCGRCGQAVFFAEKVMGGGGVSILLEQLCVCNQNQCMRTFLREVYFYFISYLYYNEHLDIVDIPQSLFQLHCMWEEIGLHHSDSSRGRYIL